MDNKTLHNKIAGLESQLDMALAELSYLNSLLLQCGFDAGTESLKAILQDILDESASL